MQAVTPLPVPKRDIFGIVAAIGAVVIFTLCAANPIRNPWTDFIHFYAGGKLLGPAMYSVADAVAIGEGIAPGRQTVDKPVYWLSRPPFHYVPFAVLAQLSYSTAAVVWSLVNLAGVSTFLLLWPSNRMRALGYSALFLPLLAVLMVAQDTVVLLGILAVALFLQRHGWEYASGILVGICVAAKPSTLMLLPLGAVAFGSWRIAGGLVTAWLGAYLVSAGIMADLFWPSRYFRYLLAVSPYSRSVPTWLIPFAAGPLAWWCRGRQPDVVYAVLLGGGLVLTPRALFYDLAILLPLVVMLHGMRLPAVTIAVSVFPVVAALAWPLFHLDGARALVAIVLLGGMYLIAGGKGYTQSHLGVPKRENGSRQRSGDSTESSRASLIGPERSTDRDDG